MAADILLCVHTSGTLLADLAPSFHLRAHQAYARFSKWQATVQLLLFFNGADAFMSWNIEGALKATAGYWQPL